MQALELEEVRRLLGTPSWADVPFMYKEDLRAMKFELAGRQDVLHWFSSSGSTGAPVVYPWTSADENAAESTLERIHASSERMAGGTAFIIAPAGLPAMWYHMGRQLRRLGLATVFTGMASADIILDLAERLNPSLLISLPLVLSRLGEMRAQRQTTLLSDGALLFSGGDVLSASRRRRIEELWGARLKNFYGLSEAFGPVARESENPEVLNWEAEGVFVEVIDPVTKRQCPIGGVGVAVITTLWERPASLVRYWTGDFFRLRGWLDEGRPMFEVRGREHAGVPGLRAGAYPADIDDVLLADPAIGNEWVVSDAGGGVVVSLETRAGINDLGEQTAKRLEVLFEVPVRLKAVPLGSLDRSVPKLGIQRPNQ